MIVLFNLLVGAAIFYLSNKVIRKIRIRRAKHILANIERHGLRLKKGWSHNPVFKHWPKNYPCFCGSGFKFKKCCLDKLPLYVKTSHLPNIEKELIETKLVVEQGMGKQ